MNNDHQRLICLSRVRQESLHNESSIVHRVHTLAVLSASKSTHPAPGHFPAISNKRISMNKMQWLVFKLYITLCSKHNSSLWTYKFFAPHHSNTLLRPLPICLRAWPSAIASSPYQGHSGVRQLMGLSALIKRSLHHHLMIRYFAYQKHYKRAAYSTFLTRQAEHSGQLVGDCFSLQLYLILPYFFRGL